MQKLLIKTNLELSKKINHVLEVNRFKTFSFEKENIVLIILDIENYQLRLLMNLIHHLKKKNNISDDEMSIFICNEMFFYNED